MSKLVLPMILTLSVPMSLGSPVQRWYSLWMMPSRARQHRDLAEGDLAVAAVEARHDALVVFDVAGDNRHHFAEVHALEGLENGLVELRDIVVPPAREVHELRVDAVALKHQRRVEGALRLADRAEQFPRLRQIAAVVEMAEGAQVDQVMQAFADAVDAGVDELGGGVLVEADAHEGAVVFEHPLPHGLQGLFPAGVLGGELAVDAWLPGLLVLQEEIGDAAVRGYDEDAVVEVFGFAMADDDIAHHFAETRHRGAADLFYSMHDRFSWIDEEDDMPAETDETTNKAKTLI